MEFCDNCGTYLRNMKTGLWCPKCKKLTKARQKIGIESVDKKQSNGIFIVDKPQNDYVRVSRQCPECGYNESFHWFSAISGEHAGIRRERTTEHFKCTRCSHSWTESA